MDHRMTAPFLAAARVSADLVQRPEVAERWTDESACEGMSVGGLAHHLIGQLAHTVRILPAGESDQAPIELLEHYERATWVEAAPDDEVNVAIRETADTHAEGGPAKLLAAIERYLTALPGVLDSAPDVVKLDWQDWSLTTDDYLVTRLMELVVHSDDLAASIEVATPEFPDDVVAAVLALLTGVATRRHGQVAVVRALSRPQRSPDSVSAF